MRSRKIEKGELLKMRLVLHRLDEPIAQTINLNVRCNQNSYNVLVSNKILILSIAKSLEIESKYEQLLKILALDCQSKQKESTNWISIENPFPLNEAQTLIEQAKKFFGRKLKVDLANFAVDYFVSEQQRFTGIQVTHSFDNLAFDTALKIFKKGYDLIPFQSRHRVGRLLKKYINQTQRSVHEKDSLTKLHKIMKNQKQEEWQSDSSFEDIADSSEPQVQAHPVRKNKNKKIVSQQKSTSRKQQVSKYNKKRPDKNSTLENKQKGPRSSKQNLSVGQKTAEIESEDEMDNNESALQPQKDQGKGKIKKKRGKGNFKGGPSRDRRPPTDQRIVLGLRGDTNAGWRERYRPKKSPAENYVEVRSKSIDQKFPNSYRNSHKQSDSPNEGKIIHLQQFKKVQQPKPSNSPLVRVHSFPENKKLFIFKDNKAYKIMVNDLFWINVQPHNSLVNIIHSKENKGFTRPGKIQLIDHGKGFMTEGLTFSFETVCNFEDGGRSWGGATVEDFVPNGKQWFALNKVDIYTNE